MSRPFDLLVAGEINPDLILAGNVTPEFGQVEKLVDSATLTIGSSSAIFACGAARLGLKTAFIGVCGDDLFGRFMLEEMQKRCVDVTNVIVRPGGATGLSVILNSGVDRAILTHPGLIAALRAEDVAYSLLAQARHLHVAGYFVQDALRPGLPELFRRAHALGLTTSLDTNYDPTERWEGFDELLAQTNIFLPNETEALSLTKTRFSPKTPKIENVEFAAKELALKCEIAVVKRGSQGALACIKDRVQQSSSIPVRVVDTVGAGDSFDAGFIYGYLNAWPIEKSLKLACICGALSTQQPGGTTGQATLEEAVAQL